MRLGLIALVALLVATCVAPVVHQTPSGQPEVTISGVQPQDVVGPLTNQMLNEGYSPRNSATNYMVFEKELNDPMAQAFFGSRYNSTPNARIAYTIANLGHSTRVVANFQIVTNPGSGLEKTTNLNDHPDSRNIQTMLNSLRHQMESR